MNTDSVVIIGAGQAGFQVAHSLRQASYSGNITLIGDETYLPYQRPPLSKAFLKGDQDEESLLLRQVDFYKQNKIELIIGQGIKTINRLEHYVQLGNGRQFQCRHLVFATGARVRRLDIPGADLDGVVYIRSLDDAKNIKTRMENAQNIVVIGGGFIGLEFAAIAIKLKKNITVIEAQSHLMARAVSPVMSDFFEEQHKNHGVKFYFNAHIKNILEENRSVKFVELVNGQLIPADMIVVGIGVVPNDQLAQDSGIACSNGIEVDAHLCTNDPDIYAVGDCAQHYNTFAKAKIRVESVQNAIDQAKYVAAHIMGDRSGYRSVPWFWSDQYDLKLQMVGINTGFDMTVLRGALESKRFSVFYYRQNTLIGIDSINQGADHMLGRKLLGQGINITPEIAADETIDLRIYLNQNR